MALFNALLPTKAADVVAIFDANSGRQLFADARPMKATIAESAKLMTHPIEDGETVVDHRIILPVGLSLSMIITADRYRETYQEIRQTFRDTIRLSVQTKTATYTNLYLQNIPHEEDPAVFDTITIILEFIEALFVRVQIQALPPAAVLNPADSSTSDNGEQTTTDGGGRQTFLRGLLG